MAYADAIALDHFASAADSTAALRADEPATHRWSRSL
jgi:hypothetical protein